jgi:hypothetical protein
MEVTMNQTNKQDWTRVIILRPVTMWEMSSFSLNIGANLSEESAACIFSSALKMEPAHFSEMLVPLYL